jgi:hypothetical protein
MEKQPVRGETEERQIMEAVATLRRLQKQMTPPMEIDQRQLRHVACLLDEIQMMCLRYLRRNGLQDHHRWAADLLLRAVWERNRLDAQRSGREQ